MNYSALVYLNEPVRDTEILTLNIYYKLNILNNNN